MKYIYGTDNQFGWKTYIPAKNILRIDGMKNELTRVIYKSSEVYKSKCCAVILREAVNEVLQNVKEI